MLPALFLDCFCMETDFEWLSVWFWVETGSIWGFTEGGVWTGSS